MTDLLNILTNDIQARLPKPWLTRPKGEPEQWISEYPKPALASWKLDGNRLILTDRRNPQQHNWDPEYNWRYKEWTYDLEDPDSIKQFEQQLREMGIPLADAKLGSGDACTGAVGADYEPQ